jgi:hypothetical protein
MKALKFLIAGLLFGIILTKSEVISWFRIQEMFRFQSFHMYGIIGSAIVVGIIGLQLAKHRKWKDIEGKHMQMAPKAKTYFRYILGGTIFGLGWAMVGACPGPMYALVGTGYSVIIVAILAGLLGTFSYGWLRDHLPH